MALVPTICDQLACRHVFEVIPCKTPWEYGPCHPWQKALGHEQQAWTRKLQRWLILNAISSHALLPCRLFVELDSSGRCPQRPPIAVTHSQVSERQESVSNWSSSLIIQQRPNCPPTSGNLSLLQPVMRSRNPIGSNRAPRIVADMTLNANPLADPLPEQQITTSMLRPQFRTE